MRSLKKLISDDIAEIAVVAATPDALLILLSENVLVRTVSKELREAEFTNIDLQSFTSQLLRDFRPGERHSSDAALCALCSSLMDVPADFVDDFLSDISSLNARELPMSSRIARLVQRERQHRFSGTTLRRYLISEILPERPRRLDIDMARSNSTEDITTKRIAA